MLPGFGAFNPHPRKCIAQFFVMKRTKTEAASDRVPILPMSDPTPVLLNIHQLAAALNVGRTTVENWTRSRRIPSMKLGRVLRYDLKRVLAALEAYERRAI